MHRLIQVLALALAVSLSVAAFLFLPVNAAENSWEIMASMPTARGSLGGAAVNGKMYAIGGYGSGYLSTNEEYDPATDMWTTKKPMPTPRSSFGIAVYQNKIYVIGGDVADGYTGGANEVYDPATDTWETKTPMPTPRACLEANVVDGKIYLIGGAAYSLVPPFMTEYGDNQVYDPASDSWTTKASIPIPSGDYASAVVGDKIYVIAGGGVPSSRNQIYDTITDTWTMGKSLPIAERFTSAAATSGIVAAERVFVIGGYSELDNGNGLNQIYDPATNNWTTGASMITPRYGLAIAVVNDVLYALGGSYGGNYLAINEQYTPSRSGIIPAQPPVDLLSWPSYRCNSGNTGFSQSSASNTNQTAWVKTGVGGAQGTTPAVADGKIFVGDENGNLYALDLETGGVIWSIKEPSPFRSSPAIADGKVFVGSEGSSNIKVFDENNGSLLWQYSTGSSAAATSVNVADGRVFFNTQNKMLYCLNATTSQLLWTFDTGLNMTYPAAVDYRVFVGHYSTDSHLLGVYCLRQSDGAILWKRESSVSTPIDSLTVAVADGEVYWFDNRPNPRVECLDEFSGNVLWSVSIPELLSSVPAAFAYNKFYLSSEDGYLYALDNGVLSWKRYVGFASYGKSASPPAVADGKVFVSTNSSIIGLDANTGDVIWTYSVSEANPPIVADGYIVFSQSNAIYAIRSDAPPTIPEFPAWTPMLLMFIVLLAIIAIHNRKPSKTQIQANTKNQELF